MYDIKEIIQELIEKKDMKEDEIPSIYLYMDQLLSLFDENFPYNYGEQKLTKTMINNYAKGGIIQPAYKKKYNKEHILMILVTCMLKREISLSEIKELVDESVEKVDNLDEKSIKKSKKSDKLANKNREGKNKKLEKNIKENKFSNYIEETSEKSDNVKLEIDEIYSKFISKKEVLEKIVVNNLDLVIENLEEDNIVSNNNKLLDVMILCYCSNILSEAARAIIRSKEDK